jgi:membrane associated rhomboid family serine protease
MIPLRDENPVRTTPVLTWLIIATCVGIYFLWQPSPASETTEDVTFSIENAAIPCELVEGRPLDTTEVVATFNQGDATACGTDSNETPPFVPEKNVWLSALTSMFLHGSLLHIGGNMLFLWVFGNNVEEALGKAGFVLFYLAGGILATATHVMLNLDSTVPMVGASGAIAAVMGAYAVLFPNARVRTLVLMLFIFVVRVRAIWLLGFWFVLQFFTDANEGVAWAAHVGGFVFGVLVGLAVRAVKPPDRDPVLAYP